jgi:ketosteroid isomerase-like protein
VRLENKHDLRGVLRTFGEEASYDDEPWEDHRRGAEAVRAYYEQLGRLMTGLTHPLTLTRAYGRKLFRRRAA